MHRLTVLELIRKSFGLGTGEIGFEGIQGLVLLSWMSARVEGGEWRCYRA